MAKQQSFQAPANAPTTDSRLSQWFGRRVFNAMGWRFEGTMPDLPKAIFIIAPHTSNWDWVISVITLWAFRLRVCYLAKHSLFKGPLGWFMRKTGGMPVQRDAPGDLADQVAGHFLASQKFWLALTPEGTRSTVSRWKTGYLRIAYASKAPVIPVVLDLRNRRITMGEPLILSGDIEQDLEHTIAFYKDRTPTVVD